MPGLYTHYLAADAAFERLPAGEMKEFLTKYRHIYDLGAQGPDFFEYYKPFSSKREDITRFAMMLQERQVDQCLRLMINYMSEQQAQQDRDILGAYLIGYISHYAVECICNPYIHYRSGFVMQGRGDPKRFRGYNLRLRNEIDALMTQKITGKGMKELDMSKHVEVDYPELNEICRMYPVILKKVYGKNSSREYIIKSYQNMYEFAKRIRRNSFLTVIWYKLVELIRKCKGEFTRRLIPSKVPDLDQLNTKKELWLMPWDNRVPKHDSFEELYEQGVDSAVKMMTAVYEAYAGRLSDISVLETTGGNSMSTGLKWNTPMVWKYYNLIYEAGISREE